MGKPMMANMLVLCVVAMALVISNCASACGGGCPGTLPVGPGDNGGNNNGGNHGSGGGGNGNNGGGGGGNGNNGGGGNGNNGGRGNGNNGGGGGGGGGGNGNNGGGARTCPVNIVSIGVCSPLLSGSIAPQCCPLLGLLGVDIEVCLCLALDVNVLGIVNIHVPKLDIIASIMTTCGFPHPTPNFICP